MLFAPRRHGQPTPNCSSSSPHEPFRDPVPKASAAAGAVARAAVDEELLGGPRCGGWPPPRRANQLLTPTSVEKNTSDIIEHVVDF